MRQQMRDRLAAESVEQREARLQHMSDTQHVRMAAETDKFNCNISNLLIFSIINN